MKKLLVYFIFSITILAISSFLLAPQKTDYDKNWKQVEENMEKGLPKSALKIVDEIYKKAKSEDNQPQLLKALIYRVSLQSRFEEDHMVNAIQTFETELHSSSTPEKQIIHSLLAELYQWYYQDNRWKINERGIAVGMENADIHTWDAVKLNKTIHGHYMASLKDQGQLQNINLDAFEIILKNVGDENIVLWPTLFDLLAHRALTYFSTPEAGLADISSQVQLETNELLSPVKEFIDLKPEGDSASNEFITISLYQRLLKLHLDSGNDKALVDLDLNRLGFMYNNILRSEQADELYIQTLTALLEKYKNNVLMVKISGQLAQQYIYQGNKFKPLEGEKYRYALNTAEGICEEALKTYPLSKESARCENLLNEIRKTHFSVKANTAELPNHPFLARVDFKNLTQLHFKIVKLDPEEELNRDIRTDREGYISSLLKAIIHKEWSQEFPDTKDHQNHSTEIKMPSLETGYYMIFASTDSLFQKQGEIVYLPVWMTNLSYIGKNNPDGSLDVYVLDRESGHPLAGVEVHAYEQVYSSRDKDRNLKNIGTFSTDQNGHIKLSLLDKMNYGSLVLSMRKDGDILHSSDRIGLYRQSTSAKLKTKTYFFTDRAIYRPGQTVYFKGIVVDKKGNEVLIKPGHKTTVSFYDVNRKKVVDLTLVANDFGSFHGSFVVPRGGLNGQMMIKNKSGSINFSVEEYKRPTFMVAFDTLAGEYKIGDEIQVSGKAENYSGNPLINASVKYRVVRSPIIMPYYRFYSPLPLYSEIEIANGTAFTQSSGNFSIQFEAREDGRFNNFRSVPYRFVIYADVTDITGEVQSGQTQILIGKEAFFLTLETADVINREEFSGIKAKATNLSGAPVNTEVLLELFYLTPPDRLLNNRRWSRSDIQLIPKEEFINDFPHDIYRDEDDKNTWEKKSITRQIIQFKGKATVLQQDLKSANPGHYKITASAITRDGDTVKTERILNLYSAIDKQLPGKMINWSAVSKKQAEPGDIIYLTVGSADKKTKLYYEIVNGDKVVDSNWVALSRGQKVIEIPVKEEYRGNFLVRTAMVRHNRSYINDHVVQVPFTNKKLDIAFETYRDFLTPGQKEEWRVRISGPDGEALAAEMMAGMYDASLDQFKENNWQLDLYQTKRSSSNFFSGQFMASGFRYLKRNPIDYKTVPAVLYPEIDWFGYHHAYVGYMRGIGLAKSAQTDAGEMATTQSETAEEYVVVEEDATDDIGQLESIPPPPLEEPTIPLRTNFNETAFFYPVIRTDSLSDVLLVFTTPDALTEWKMMMLATTKDLKTGTLVKKFKAKKDLMIIPNVPRFVRQGDQLVFTAKVVNFADKPIRGEADIEFFNALTMEPVNLFEKDTRGKITLSIGPEGNQLVSWRINIPFDLSMLSYRITAKTGDFTDGEERMIPVLTNRLLVTETLPMPLKGKESRTFTMDKLLISDKTMMASSRKNYRFTVEFTSNPAWYAVQALPYMSEPKTENSGNLFYRFYANALSGFIINSNPKIKNIFEAWSQHTPEAFYSNLQKNDELKSAVLEATPWVLEAEDEAEQKRRIAILFDVNRLANEKELMVLKLSQNQMSDGAWPWFKGMRPDRHTTQRIILGFAKLSEKGIIELNEDPRVKKMVKNALVFLDKKIAEDYSKLKKNNPKNMASDNLGSLQIEYLYLRSILSEVFPVNEETAEAFGYYSGQAKKYWLKKSTYLQGMLALTLYRFGQRNEAEAIIRSLKERSLTNDEMGMYWREEWNWRWYQAPVETQSMLIEAFNTVNKDSRSVEQMKIWLLKQKQTNRWKTTSATAEAVFALLMTGDNLLLGDELVTLKVGDKTISPKTDPDLTAETGTGYFKTSWSGDEIKATMGKIEASNPNSNISWGAAYWQYFEDLDKITAHDSPLSIEKQIFVEELTEDGPVIRPLEVGEKLNTGDKVNIRLIIRTDRNMEYIHVKDMRSSSLEPTTTLSGYHWNGGLGYYRNIKDVSTDFFIQYLQKGTYVLEYPLVVTQKGDFSNGIAIIQSYYAPEFGAHSNGVRLVVE